MSNRILNTIRKFPHWPWLERLLEWSKQVTFPGFGKVPLYTVLVFVIKECRRDTISTRANSIAFNLVLAIFPGIIFLFTLIPLMPFSDYYEGVIVNAIQGALPTEAAVYINDIIRGVTSKMRGGLLSVGFFFSAFFASNGMLNLMFGFDKSYENTYKSRSYFKKNAIAVVLTFLLLMLFLVSVILIIVGDYILAWIFAHVGSMDGAFFFSALRWILAVLLIYSGVSVIYRYGPSMKRRISFLNPGAILATSLSVSTSILFSFFINNFGRYNEFYGSIGALIIVMVWLQFNAYILLIGYELNASIAVNRDLLEDRED